MNLDVDVLGTFYEMAREGARLAANRLTPMADIRVRVGVTRLNFTTRSAIRAEFDDGVEKVGIRVELDGGLEGVSLIVFDRDSAIEVAETLVDDVPDDGQGLMRSAIVECSQIMNNGFVDGWADVLRVAIDTSTPEFVAGTSSSDFLGDATESQLSDELVVAFRSKLEAVDTEIRFQHYFFPTHDSIAELFEQRTGQPSIEYEKLAGFDAMAQQGAQTVAENLTKLTGMDMDVDVRRINFIALDAIPGDVSNEKLVSVAFSFDGMPSGYLLFLFDEASARKLVEATVGTSPGDGFGDLERDCIQEMANIMASGLLDGWANVLDTTIDHSTPAYTYDMGAAVVDPLIVGLSERQEFAFVFDTRIEAVETEFDLDIYAIPDEGDLKAALDSLDMTRVEETPVIAEFVGGEARPEEFESVESVESAEEVEGGDVA